jgi:membrane protein required for colicin V production
VNSLDFVVVGVIVLSGLFAFARGFVREALSIVCWLGASAAAIYATPHLRPLAQRFLPPGPVADAAAAGVTFLVTLIVLSVITARVSRRVQQSSLSSLDRTLGLVFGLGRGALLACIGFIALTYILPPNGERPHWFTDSRTMPLIASVTTGIAQLLPETFRERAAKINPRASIENEVESAIRAYSTPGTKTGATPAYAPEDQARLNTLFQQLSTDPQVQRYLQDHPDAQAQLNRLQQQQQQQGH